MKTEIVRINPVNPEQYKIDYCGAVLRYGGLVAFPTETVYGLGANAFLAPSVSRVFEAKGRPGDNPLIVHVSDFDMVSAAGKFADAAQQDVFMKLGASFWPGPLTMIIKKRAAIPENVSCGLPTVGIRMPSNRIANALIRAAGVPIAAPSANSSGRPSPTRFSHVAEDLNGKVDVIIDGGDSAVGVESTVLDLSGAVPVILRPGAVTRDDIAAIAGQCDEFDWRRNKSEPDRPLSPGMKYRHYAPRASMTVYYGEPEDVRKRIAARIKEEKSAGKRVGVLATDEQICYYKEADTVLALGHENSPEEHAKSLFDALRRFDESGSDVIFAHAPGFSGVDGAVMNRLFRAAGGSLEEVGKE